MTGRNDLPVSRSLTARVGERHRPINVSAVASDSFVPNGVDEQFASGSYSPKKALRTKAEVRNDIVDTSKPRFSQQFLLVGNPLTTTGQDRMSGVAGCLTQQTGALSDPAVAGVALLGVNQGQLSPFPPDCGCRFSKRLRVLPARQVPSKSFVDPEFGKEDVTRQPCLVEQQRLDREVASAGILVNPVDESQIAVVNINLLTVNRQLPAAVEYGSPAAEVAQSTGPTEFSDVFRVKPAVVIHGNVPVAVRVMCSLCPGTAEGDALHAGHALQRIHDMLNEIGFETVI